jgi:hypothetical protein
MYRCLGVQGSAPGYSLRLRCFATAGFAAIPAAKHTNGEDRGALNFFSISRIDTQEIPAGEHQVSHEFTVFVR